MACSRRRASSAKTMTTQERRRGRNRPLPPPQSGHAPPARRVPPRPLCTGRRRTRHPHWRGTARGSGRAAPTRRVVEDHTARGGAHALGCRGVRHVVEPPPVRHADRPGRGADRERQAAGDQGHAGACGRIRHRVEVLGTVEHERDHLVLTGSAPAPGARAESSCVQSFASDRTTRAAPSTSASSRRAGRRRVGRVPRPGRGRARPTVRAHTRRGTDARAAARHESLSVTRRVHHHGARPPGRPGAERRRAGRRGRRLVHRGPGACERQHLGERTAEWGSSSTVHSRRLDRAGMPAHALPHGDSLHHEGRLRS